MIEGLSHLLTMRKSGLRPRFVMVSVYCPYIKPIYARDFECMELTVHDSVASDDFRAFKDLQVTLYVGDWDQLATEVFEKLKRYASEITVLCAEYGEDIGYFWSSEYGSIDLDDYKWVIQYHDARKSVCKTDKEHKNRLRLEAEAISHIPHLEKIYGATAAR